MAGAKLQRWFSWPFVAIVTVLVALVSAPSAVAAEQLSADQTISKVSQVKAEMVGSFEPQKVKKHWFDPRLRQRGNWLQSRRSRSDSAIAVRYGRGFGFWTAKTFIRFVPVGAADQTAALFERQVAVFPNVGSDGDALLRTGPDGVELQTLLRSAEAPQQFEWRVKAGGGLRLLTYEGNVVGIRRSRIVLVIRPPWALDASGHGVPTYFTVNGSRVRLTIAHRSAGITYPLLANAPFLAPPKGQGLLNIKEPKQRLQAAAGQAVGAGALTALAIWAIRNQQLVRAGLTALGTELVELFRGNPQPQPTPSPSPSPAALLPPVVYTSPPRAIGVRYGGGGYWGPPSARPYRRPPPRPPPPPPLTASLDDQFPKDGTVRTSRGAPPVEVGWNVRFNRAFDASRYVLRPDTVSSVTTFAGQRGDFPGRVAPNDNRVGYFRTTVQVPRSGVAPGSYLIRWTVVDKLTGRSAGLQPSMMVVVDPAQFVGPWEEVVIPTSGERRVKVFVRNRSDRIWQQGKDNIHFVDPNGNDLQYPYCGQTPDWINGNAVAMDQKTVAPGYVASYTVRICGEQGYQGTAVLRLQYVHEAVAHASEVFSLHLRFTPDPNAPSTYPRTAPPDGEPAGFLRPSEEVFIETSGSRLVPVWVRNQTARVWRRGKDNLHFVDDRGNDLQYPYCGETPEWINGNAVAMTQEQVAPGEVAIFLVKVCGQAGYVGTATMRLQFIEEGVAHNPPIFPMRLRFGPPPPGTFLGPESEGAGQELVVPTGGERTVEVALRNDSSREWLRGVDNLHFVDEFGNDLTYTYCGATPAWINGNAVLMREDRVAPGQVAHFAVKICGTPGYEGPATLRLQYVEEAVAHHAPIFPLRLMFRP